MLQIQNPSQRASCLLHLSELYRYAAKQRRRVIDLNKKYEHATCPVDTGWKELRYSAVYLVIVLTENERLSILIQCLASDTY